MRYEEASTKFDLKYTPWDVESMKQALDKYTRLIATGEAFEDDYCVAHFTLDLNLLSDELKIYHKDFIQGLTENKQCHTGEHQFYQIAVEIPGLKESIISSCRAMVQYARDRNDSSRMWLTCEMPFGIEPLYLTATKYPEYGYLLASFLISNWDTEHMYEPIGYLRMWSEPIGITEDTIKAFCYCDNNLAREEMLGFTTWDGGGEEYVGETNFDLINHFRKDNSAFYSFRNTLISRYKDMAILIDDENQNRYNPIKQIIIEIMYPTSPYDVWDDDFDLDQWLIQTFIDSSAEKEIEDSTLYIEKVLKQKITTLFTTKKEVELDSVNPTEEESEEEGVKKWHDLFLKIYPNGARLWSYVQEGQHKEILETIESIDIVKKAKETKALYYEEFKEACSYKTPIQDELSSFFREYYKARKEGDHTETELLNEITRIYDVIHRSLGYPIVSDDLRYYFSRTIKVMNRHQIIIRYPQHWTNELPHLIGSLDCKHGSNSNNLKVLNRLHSIIQENREEASTIILDYYNDSELRDRASSRRSQKDVSKIALTVVALAIMYFDQERKVKDKLTNASYKFTEEHLKRILIEEIYSETQFPSSYEIEQYSAEKVFDDQLKKGRQAVILEDILMWKKVLNFLNTEHILDADANFKHCLYILKTKLKYDDRIDIAEDQRNYDLYSFKEEVAPLIVTAWLTQQIKSAPHKEFMKRWLKLSFQIAPLRTAGIIETLNPSLKKPEQFESYIQAVDSMKTMGLTDEAYWAYQLESLHKQLVDRDLDIKSLDKEPKYVQQYIQLIRLHIDSLDDITEPSNPIGLVANHLTNLKVNLNNGIRKYIERNSHSSFVFRAMEVFGIKAPYQNKLDSLAIEKIKRDLYDTICGPEKYYESYLNKFGIENSIQKYYTGDPNFISSLNEIQTSELTDQQYESLKRQYYTHKSGWVQTAIVLRENKGRSLYNADVLNYLAEAVKRGESFVVSSLTVLYVAPCNEQHLQAITAYEGLDFNNTIMSFIDAYFFENKPFSFIEKLLDFSFWNNGLYCGITNYSEFSLANTFLHLSPKIQEQILNIICTLHMEDVDELYRCNQTEGRKKISSIMYENDMNPKMQFRFNVFSMNRPGLVALAEKHDCSNWIKECNIDNTIYALKCLSYMPKHHALLCELQNHPSLKIKRAAKSLINAYKINEADLALYHIIDYGTYKMCKEEKVVDRKENVTREANAPVCIKQTTTIKATHNSYMGLRFTSLHPAKMGKVCEHRVTITHPARNKDGVVEMIQSGWNQNGYNDSAIFLGWFFDPSEEILEGTYHLAAFDLNGKLLVEKQIEVKK
ncbi:DUF3859 domain-containing protein [Halosquirtibacter xylanolyticus]|uniref:hypothetical protein n=1 Tax=Halosquirtibacter xylanolyticus TaxID=3374599 RepID=UPI0037487E91|nr:DUF3859 domain-containing protein [Prolixibacteraceae bacterium]